MKVEGSHGVNAAAGGMGAGKGMDSVSKNIQSQIQKLQEQLQELSSNENLSLEEKMKKRQEIQKQIMELNTQLRQHQIEQRKKEREAKAESKEDALGGSPKPKKKEQPEAGFSSAGMQALISADSAMEQAKVQKGVATRMEGKAGVLEIEIKMDSGRGRSVEQKQQELADTKAAVVKAETSQIEKLSEANHVLEEASKSEQEENVDSEQDRSSVPEGNRTNDSGADRSTDSYRERGAGGNDLLEKTEVRQYDRDGKPVPKEAEVTVSVQV